MAGLHLWKSGFHSSFVIGSLCWLVLRPGLAQISVPPFLKGRLFLAVGSEQTSGASAAGRALGLAKTFVGACKDLGEAYKGWKEELLLFPTPAKAAGC